MFHLEKAAHPQAYVHFRWVAAGSGAAPGLKQFRLRKRGIAQTIKEVLG